MRFLVFSLLITFLLVSCSTEKNILSKKIQVTLIDENTNAYIEGGEVSLISIVGNADFYQDKKYTDGNGECSFMFDYNVANQYRIHALKEGLLTYLVNDSLGFSKSSTDIDANTSEELTLYLTSDSMNHYNYWKELTPRYEMDELTSLLKTNNFAEGLPWLTWEDIPALLAVGNDSTVITNFPHNPISSYLLDECYVGITILWLVESIRITERDNLVSPVEKYPSLNPILKFKNPPETVPENSIEKMNTAFQAYQEWWGKVQNLEVSEACKVDPLENENLTWN